MDEINKDTISHQIEAQKALLDYCKHLTTLSTGSIVIVAGFIEKVFPSPQWKLLTAISLICFMISILGAIIEHTVLLINFPPKLKLKLWTGVLGGMGLFLAWGGFLIGIFSLAIFAVKNLL